MKLVNYKNWEKILIKELLKLWNESKKFLPCHGPSHHLRVWENAKFFGKNKGADLDVLLAACLFHDVSSFNPKVPDGHDVASAKIAKQVLKKVKFPKEKINSVVLAIESHRSSNKNQNSLEGKIMKTFDKLDAFGPVGVYRILTPWSIRKCPIEQIVYWALGDNKLQKKWKSIPFLELKKEYRKDYEYTIQYFKNLAKQLKISQTKKSDLSEKIMYYE